MKRLANSCWFTGTTPIAQNQFTDQRSENIEKDRNFAYKSPLSGPSCSPFFMTNRSERSRFRARYEREIRDKMGENGEEIKIVVGKREIIA